MSRVLIYGDVSVNIIDGSSIWLVSMARVASQVFDEVHVVLKFAPKESVLVEEIAAHPAISLHLPDGEDGRDQCGHSPQSAADHAERLAHSLGMDAVVVRGMEAAAAFAASDVLAPLLWAYVTDLPFPPARRTARGDAKLEEVARRARAMFAQTESARSYLEAIAPSSAGKTALLPPMIPDEVFEAPPSGRGEFEVLRMVYSGKFARAWRTMEMLSLPRALARRGVRAELTVIGSKFQRDTEDPTWHSRMQAALEAAHADDQSGVTWVGAVARSRSLKLIRQHDVGLGWRSSSLDSTVELSTKALEYAACSVAPVVNRTVDHEALLGSDYPLLIHATATVEDLADRIVAARPHISEASRRGREAARGYSMERAVARLRRAFRRSGVTLSNPATSAVQTVSRKRVLIAAHDWKFMGELLVALRGAPDVDVAIDPWDSLHHHDESRSRALLQDADTVFCEWAGPNLAWYSQHVRHDQRLVSRLHGFELRSGTWLQSVALERLDHLVVVSDHYRDKAVERLGMPANQTTVIPNMLDADDLARPKLAGSQFRLGLVGYVPFLKRPDRAIDLLERLLEVDNRYSLFVKGRPPWEYPYHWNATVERQRYLQFFRRIGASERLRRAVVFEPFSADIASWLRKIGIVLSPSDLESFHMAPAEALASGGAAVVWPREGAIDVFGPDRVIDGVEHAAESVLALRDPERFGAASAMASARARASWDIESVFPAWRAVLGLHADAEVL